MENDVSAEKETSGAVGRMTYDAKDKWVSKFDRIPTSVEQIEVGSIRLHRLVQDNGCDRVTVEVEIDGEWIEVIRELHENYFDHFVSASGIRMARAMKRGGEHGRAMP